MNTSTPVFDLAEINSHWKGVRIESLKAPLLAGIAKLREQSAGKQCLGFALVSEFDYDGLIQHVDHLQPFPDRATADATLLGCLDAYEAEILARDPGWKRVYDNVLPPEILPATFNVVAGNFGHQFVGRGYKHTIPYDSIYVRMIRIDQAEGELVDQLLALDGLKDEIVDGLISVGKAG